MNKLTTKQFLVISLMLFSLFFGAGNLIFPPMVGKLAGEDMIIAMISFCLTAVVLPVLGVVAIARCNGLSKMGLKVSPWFSTVFAVSIYLAVGPLMGIPRAGTVPFEIGIAPSISNPTTEWIALLLFTIVFFAITYWFCLNPDKIANRVGKYLSPILLLLMVALFIWSFVSPMGEYAEASGAYKDNPVITGFLEGYLTMDAVGALSYGLVIAMAINAFNIKSEKEVMKSTIATGVLAGVLLFIIYFMLAHIGATSVDMFPNTTNGAQLLNAASNHIFGGFGAYIVAGIFTLACLTTCVGLISASAKYFAGKTERLGYKGWVVIWTISSFCIANVGLETILSYSVPLLGILYPIAIVLIVLVLFDSLFKSNKLIYQVTIYSTSIISIFIGLKDFPIPYLKSAIDSLPLASYQLAWVLPSILAFIGTTAFIFIRQTVLKPVKEISK